MMLLLMMQSSITLGGSLWALQGGATIRSSTLRAKD
jgi:hypothetical protein